VSLHLLDEALLETVRGQLFLEVEGVLAFDLFVPKCPVIGVLLALLSVPL